MLLVAAVAAVLVEDAAFTDDTAARRVVRATAEGNESMSALAKGIRRVVDGLLVVVAVEL